MSNYNRGTLALQKGKLDKAIQLFKRETAEFKELYLNLGNAYRLSGESTKAWQMYILANDSSILDLEGNGGEYVDALGNMGLLAYQEGNDILAQDYYYRALVIQPLHYNSIWNYSLALLREYCSGMPLHKDAWKMHEYRTKAIKYIPTVSEQWDGKSFVDKIVVINEQGMGDKLMYGRYLKLVAGYCNELWVHCPSQMFDVFSEYKTCNTLTDSGCTVGIPFACLPSIFGIIPGEWLDYPKLEHLEFRVAVEWSGSSTHLNDKNRSCYAGYFSNLRKKFTNIKFINVRPDAKAIAGIETLKCKSWSESAMEVASCDLVITVDTSLVHLAGSLGVDTLMIQPLCDTDFRWGNPRTKELLGFHAESNIWYSSVSVIENTGWDRVFIDIEKRIHDKQRNWFTKQLLGGLTIEEFVEKTCLH